MTLHRNIETSKHPNIETSKGWGCLAGSSFRPRDAAVLLVLPTLSRLRHPI
jgi:hypothetical protein